MFRILVLAALAAVTLAHVQFAAFPSAVAGGVFTEPAVVARHHTGAYNFDNFLGTWGKYHTKYSNYFLNYCNYYLQAYPSGRFVNQARKYVTTFGGNQGYAPAVGGSKFGDFYNLYGQYHGSYSKYFLGYCQKYIQALPTGPYAKFARGYIAKYAGPNYGIPAATVATLGSAGIAAVKAFPHENRSPAQRGEVALDYKTPVINNGYGANNFNFNNFMGYWKQYNTGYNPWFVNYCNSYLTSHPTGKFVPYVRRYLTSFGGAGYGPTGAIVGGAAYGPTGAIVGGDAYGASPYNFNNFMGYYKQYHGGYSKYFVDYCNNYVQTHPRGQYLTYANQYLSQYLPGYGATPAVAAPGYGANNFNNFMGYWKQYNTGYNPWFVNYCNSYLTSHPTGKFLPYVRQYLTTYGAGYGPTGPAIASPAVLY